MAGKRFKPKRRPPSFRPKRTDVRRALWFIPLLLLGGALLQKPVTPDSLGQAIEAVGGARA